MSWPVILKTVIVGTERSPLPEGELASLGFSLSGNPAQIALEALAAANLARKAGFRLIAPSAASASQVSAGRKALAGQDGKQLAAATLDPRPVCSPATVQDLDKILSGLYADALPEFLDLLVQNNFRLPPECLPDLLEKAVRDGALADKIRPALGPCGEWLARQNPGWSSLLAEDTVDWFTASFAERKQLLQQTRARNPLLALAWLEKTWPEEKPSHKAQFLEILHIRLSPMDEDVLEKAFSEKNWDLRWAGVQLLVLLPESRKLAAMKTFFREKLAGAFVQRENFLKKSLPDISEEALQPWLALLPAAVKGQHGRTGNWRNELLFLFICLLPPAELLLMTGLSQEQVLQSLDDAKGSTALLEAIICHTDASWIEPVLRHFSRDFRHAVWQSKAMTAFLTLFAPETMDFLQKNNISINYENERILRALENCHCSWPKDLLHYLLEQYRQTFVTGRSEIPGWHYTLALQTAAYHCFPADAAGSEAVRAYLQNPPNSRPREFEAFLGILRFRQEMAGHFASTLSAMNDVY